ncbi:MAG: DVU0298 family protein [bacterium]
MKLSRKRPTAPNRKETLRALLRERDHDALLRWAQQDRQAVRTVFSALFEPDPLLRWRAIEALGLLADRQSGRDPETVREWLRRLLWNMNDESGGLMWHGPEAIAAILVNVSALIPEFVMLLFSYHVQEPFEAGTYTALARIADLEPKRVAPFWPLLEKGLEDADPRIRAYAARIAELTGERVASPETLARVRQERTPLTVYDHELGTLRETTVGAVATGSP